MSIIKFAIGVILVILLAPFAIGILPIWWLFAKILGIFHPDRDYFPIKRAWTSLRDWLFEKTGLNIEDLIGAAAIALIVSSFIRFIEKRFIKEK